MTFEGKKIFHIDKLNLFYVFSLKSLMEKSLFRNKTNCVEDVGFDKNRGNETADIFKIFNQIAVFTEGEEKKAKPKQLASLV